MLSSQVEILPSRQGIKAQLCAVSCRFSRRGFYGPVVQRRPPSSATASTLFAHSFLKDVIMYVLRLNCLFPSNRGLATEETLGQWSQAGPRRRSWLRSSCRTPSPDDDQPTLRAGSNSHPLDAGTRPIDGWRHALLALMGWKCSVRTPTARVQREQAERDVRWTRKSQA